MTTHALAVIFGPFELFFLFILLAAPVILAVAHVFFMARFKNSRLDLRTEEARILSELAQLEAESASGQNEELSTSARREPDGLTYALQSE